MSFQRMMETWLKENYTQVSIYSTGLLFDWEAPDLVLYFNGFRIGWISETEFAMGNGRHYSTMSNFEKLSPADPKFFDIIKERLQRIGAK